MLQSLRIAFFSVCAASLGALVCQTSEGGDKGFVDLFNGKDLTGWKTNIFGKDDGKTFTVKDDYILVSGKPNGYFYTDKSYKNYVLKFDWRYMRPANLEDENEFGGNSGLLVHIQGHRKTWPISLEVQGMNKTHASFIAIGGKAVGLTDYKFDQKTLNKVRNKVGEWNTTEVTVKNGEVTAKVNGTPISSGKITLTEGPFGFQSEGAELHFKNIKIKVLPDGAGRGAGGVQGKVNVGGKPLAGGTIEFSTDDGKLKVAGSIAKDGTFKLDVPAGKVRVTIAVGDDKGFKPLFNGKDLKGWKTFLGKDPKRDTGDPQTVIVVKDGEIQVSGNPWGYFYTEKSFKNYVIRYSWTYPKNQPDKTTMNSGLLVHIQEPHKVWPKSIEPQGRYKDHGKIFFPGWPKDAKHETTFDEKAQKKALKASDEWNTTEATVRGDGSIEVRINGVLVSTVKTELTSGPIGFQSEGARIHFKDIKIKMLD